jgi:hypothetical protein
MYSTKFVELRERAEHLLWVIARCDVEGLAEQRRAVLRQLQDLEESAGRLGILNLYREVLRSSSLQPIKSSYDDR